MPNSRICGYNDWILVTGAGFCQWWWVAISEQGRFKSWACGSNIRRNESITRMIDYIQGEETVYQQEIMDGLTPILEMWI